jgi:hypothetical protein
MSTGTATTRDRQHLEFGTLAKRGPSVLVAANIENAAIPFAAAAAGIAPSLNPLSTDL